MKPAVFIVVLVLLGCSSSDGFQVISYKQVDGAESAPWHVGCLALIENRSQRIVGINGGPCNHIKLGDKAVFNTSGDTVFWVNDQPYNVRMVQAK